MKIKLVVPFFIFMAILAMNSLVTGQSKLRTIEQGNPYPGQPLEVVEKRVGEDKINEGRIVAGPNWLKELSITFRNASGKTITYIDCILHIDKQGAMEAGYALPLLYENRKQPIGPGEFATLKVSDEQYFGLMKRLAQYQIEDVDKVFLVITRVYFNDSTRWVTGKESRQDPADKNKWIPISKQERLNVFFECKTRNSHSPTS